MAAVKVTIIYGGPVVEFEREGMQICRIFVPNNSYVDSPVFVNGYPNDESLGNGEAYGKSIYATNVVGWGEFPGLIPMASTTTKFAQFERAVIAKFDAEAKGEENKGIEFEVEGYEEEIYWNQIGRNMADLGFYIQVGDAEYGVKPESGEGEGGDEPTPEPEPDPEP